MDCSTMDYSIAYPEIRTAIALNNMGCKMMERGCYRQAAETLQDAAVLIKASSQMCELPKKSDVGAMIHRAVRRAASPEKCRNVSSDLSWLVVTDEVDYFCVEQVLSALASRQSMCFPICIETVGGNQSYINEDPSLLSAIILHNFGLTCVARSSGTPNTKAKHRLLQNGYKLFQLCQSILSNYSEVYREQSDLKRLFFVGIAVISGLLQCLPDNDPSTDANTYRAKLDKLKAGVVELGRSEHVYTKFGSAAAA